MSEKATVGKYVKCSKARQNRSFDGCLMRFRFKVITLLGMFANTEGVLY